MNTLPAWMVAGSKLEMGVVGGGGGGGGGCGTWGRRRWSRWLGIGGYHRRGQRSRRRRIYDKRQCRRRRFAGEQRVQPNRFSNLLVVRRFHLLRGWG